MLRRTILAIATAALLATVYSYCFFVAPRGPGPAPLRDLGAHPAVGVHRIMDAAANWLGLARPTGELRTGVYLILTAGLGPWGIMALLGRGRLYDLGVRRPNRYGWRLAGTGYLLSLPFLFWMVHSGSFVEAYGIGPEGAVGWSLSVYFAVNLLVEHFFLNGVILAVCRADRRWPLPAPVAIRHTRSPTPLGSATWQGPAPRAQISRLTRAAVWLGLANPTGDAKGVQRLTRWIGVPDGSFAAMLISGVLFGLVHLGKDPREFVLSLPGGFAAAYVAYRTNTWLTPLALHAATAATAFVMIVMQQDSAAGG